MASDQSLNKEYLPVAGLTDFCEASTRLLLGEDSPAIQEQRVCHIIYHSRYLSEEVIDF